MPRKKLYEVVCADTLDLLEKEVNDLVLEGYEPLGGIAVKGEFLMQAMKRNVVIVKASNVIEVSGDTFVIPVERARQI